MASPMVEVLEVPRDRIITAYDGMEWSGIRALGAELSDVTGIAKANDVALEEGWSHTIQEFEAMGQLGMADQKFHDTPETVRKDLYRMTRLGSGLITVHVSGGIPMMQAAVEGRDHAREDKDINGNERAEDAKRLHLPMGVSKERVGNILGITILTSLDDEEVNEIYGIGSEEFTTDVAKNLWNLHIRQPKRELMELSVLVLQ